MQIREIQKKDFKKVIQFAIKGMHFEAYLENRLILNAYGRYFWYLEYANATQVLAAYEENELLGVLVIDMKNEPKPYKSLWRSVYIKFVDVIQNMFFGGGVMPYNEANQKMYARYTKIYKPDGEIRFLAANPDIKVKGVGTFLLNELARIKPGKEIYLYTDTNCTYQFYEHRGFERFDEQNIVLELQDNVDLKCLMYRKKL